MAFLTTTDYHLLHEAVATRHKEIGNGAIGGHFARVKLNPTPFPFDKDELGELVNAMKSRIQTPFFVSIDLVSRVTFNRDADNWNQRPESAFVLLEQVGRGDYDGQDAAKTNMGRIALECLAWIRQQYLLSANRADRFFEHGEISVENIGPVAGNYFGVRVDYPLMHTANDVMGFDASKFV